MRQKTADKRSYERRWLETLTASGCQLHGHQEQLARLCQLMVANGVYAVQQLAFLEDPVMGAAAGMLKKTKGQKAALLTFAVGVHITTGSAAR